MAQLYSLSLNSRTTGCPRSFYLLSGGFLFAITFFVRFIARAARELKGFGNSRGQAKRAMIIGAGAAGAGLIKEIKANPSLRKKIICLVDDDESKDWQENEWCSYRWYYEGYRGTCPEVFNQPDSPCDAVRIW